MGRKKKQSTKKKATKGFVSRPKKNVTRARKRKKRQSATGSKVNFTRALHEIFGSNKKRDTAQKIMFYTIVFPFILIANGFILLWTWASKGKWKSIKLPLTIFILTPFFFISVILVYLVVFAIAFFPSIIAFGIAMSLFIHKFAWYLSKRFEKWQKSTQAYKRRNPTRKLRPTRGK